MKLGELEVYRLSREVGREAWVIYERMEWQDKKIIGDQWITSVDSVGANIAEGFGRFHYLDKNKFNYNARGSLLEAFHWTDIIFERKKMSQAEHDSLKSKLVKIHIQLNNYINATRRQVTTNY